MEFAWWRTIALLAAGGWCSRTCKPSTGNVTKCPPTAEGKRADGEVRRPAGKSDKGAHLSQQNRVSDAVLVHTEARRAEFVPRATCYQQVKRQLQVSGGLRNFTRSLHLSDLFWVARSTGLSENLSLSVECRIPWFGCESPT